MKIIVDNREKRPFAFTGRHYADVEIQTRSLATGDYSLAGLTDRIAIERKSLADLTICLGQERDRFLRELQRAAAYECFAVIVEASWQELAQGQYRSRLNPHAACQSVLSFMSRYGISFLFAGSRNAAEYCCYSILRQYLEGARKRLDALIKAHEAA